MKKWSVLLLILLCIGCDSKKREIEKLVKTWQNKEIIFPDSLEMKIYGRDTTLDIYATKYKILNYIDTNGCTSCRLRLLDWQLLKEDINELQLDVQIVFVAHVNEFKDLENIQKANRFDTPLLYDRTGRMNQLNHFPDHPAFQTFLLDEKNRIVLIGSPIQNDPMWELYKKEIKK